jgi:hypothetical protein
VRQRIERILDYAATRQYRSGDNPAAHDTESLPKGGNGKSHLAALAYAELPPFHGRAAQPRFNQRTRARVHRVNGGQDGRDHRRDVGRVYLKTGVWTVPASRMKAGKEHKVPLCDRTVEILPTNQIMISLPHAQYGLTTIARLLFSHKPEFDMKRTLTIAAALTVIGALSGSLEQTFAQDEGTPPNAIESDQSRTNEGPATVAASAAVQVRGSTTDAEEIIPLAPRIGNAPNNPPVDEAVHD